MRDGDTSGKQEILNLTRSATLLSAGTFTLATAGLGMAVAGAAAGATPLAPACTSTCTYNPGMYHPVSGGGAIGANTAFTVTWGVANVSYSSAYVQDYCPGDGVGAQLRIIATVQGGDTYLATRNNTSGCGTTVGPFSGTVVTNGFLVTQVETRVCEYQDGVVRTGAKYCDSKTFVPGS